MIQTQIKNLLTLAALLLAIPLWAQYAQIEQENKKIEPFVRYYKFYDGVQMIELDYLSAFHETVNTLEQEHPRALHWESLIGPAPENVYIFRNQTGIRVKQFGKITGKVKLLSVKKSKKVAIPHRHFSAMIGSSYGFSGIRTRVYPYYLIGEENNPKNKFGLIDSLGNVVLEQKYDLLYSNLGGTIFITRYDSTYEVRSTDLALLYSTSDYVLQLGLDQSVVQFTTLNKRGIMEPNGKVIVPCEYQIIWPFNDYGLARVRDLQNREGFVDSTGREVIECKYQNFGHFKEGLVDARLNDQWGYVDTLGQTVIPFQYDIGGWFENGRAMVAKKIEGVYYFGFVDTQGNEVIPLKYSKATHFRDGIAEVRTDFPDSNALVRSSMSAKDLMEGKKPSREGNWIKIDINGNEVK